jgi:hypothetical protein
MFTVPLIKKNNETGTDYSMSLVEYKEIPLRGEGNSTENGDTTNKSGKKDKTKKSKSKKSKDRSSDVSKKTSETTEETENSVEDSKKSKHPTKHGGKEDSGEQLTGASSQESKEDSKNSKKIKTHDHANGLSKKDKEANKTTESASETTLGETSTSKDSQGTSKKPDPDSKTEKSNQRFSAAVFTSMPEHNLTGNNQNKSSKRPAITEQTVTKESKTKEMSHDYQDGGPLPLEETTKNDSTTAAVKSHKHKIVNTNITQETGESKGKGMLRLILQSSLSYFEILANFVCHF